MEQSGISTAARRIVRAANDHVVGYRLYFDATGHLVQAVYGQNCEPVNPDGTIGVRDYHIQINNSDRGRRAKLTQRGVQTTLDATAACDTIGRLDLAEWLLRDWEDADELGKPRREMTTDLARRCDAINAAVDAEYEADYQAWTQDSR